MSDIDAEFNRLQAELYEARGLLLRFIDCFPGHAAGKELREKIGLPPTDVPVDAALEFLQRTAAPVQPRGGGEMTELAIGVVLLAVLVWWQVVVEWRRYKRRELLQDVMVRFTVDVSAFRDALLRMQAAMPPAMTAINDFADAFRSNQEGESDQ